MANDLPFNSSRDRTAAVVLSLCFFAWSLSGCRLTSSADHVEKLESHIRTQDSTIRSLEQNLTDTRNELESIRRQRSEMIAASRQSSEISSTPAFRSASITRLDINRLLSGGLDRDGIPGDETITILVTPRNSSGEAVRTDGRLEIELLDFTRPAEEQRIAHWQWTEEETAQAWYAGVFGDGFRLTAPMPQLPMTGQVTVHARFFTVDNQQFDVVSPLLLRTSAPAEGVAAR